MRPDPRPWTTPSFDSIHHPLQALGPLTDWHGQFRHALPGDDGPAQAGASSLNSLERLRVDGSLRSVNGVLVAALGRRLLGMVERGLNSRIVGRGRQRWAGRGAQA